MIAAADARESLNEVTRAFYCRTLALLNASGIRYLVGGAYALERYTGVARHTKDLDVFIHRRDYEAMMHLLTSMGCETEHAFPHWLGKARCGEDFIDIIFSSGNAIAEVDDDWFAHAVPSTVLGVDVLLCPPEETIWSKAFVMERERYDGADIAHLLRGCGWRLNWPRLLGRFGPHWRVLLSHLVMFGFIYPTERAQIPDWVMHELLDRMHHESRVPPPGDRVCHGTLISRAQYLIDIELWGYRDARITPRGAMTHEQVAHWTSAIERRD